MAELDLDLDLDAIKARAEAATEGSWEAQDYSGDPGDEGSCITAGEPGTMQQRAIAYAIDYSWTTTESCAADATFIAAARTDVPALVAEVERLRADLATANTIMEAQRAHPEGEDVECSVCDHVFARDVEKVYDENATLTSQVEQLERDLAAVRFALAGRDADYDALAARLDPS